MIELELLSIKIFLVKVTQKTGQENYLLPISVLKTNPWTNNLEGLNGEK